jgi:RNA polymerase sigma-70 factor, ECF subfamily
MTPNDEETFDALLQQARSQLDELLTRSVDVDGLLAAVKQRAAKSHAVAVRSVRHQRVLLAVGTGHHSVYCEPVTLTHRRITVQDSAARLRPADGHLDNIYSDTSTDLAEIVAAAVVGDRAATERLLNYVRPLIVRYCRAQIGRQERTFASADDVAQEVCLTVLTALDGYRHQSGPFLAFVYGIAAHKVADAHRMAARNRTEPVAEVPDEPHTDLGPEQRMELTGQMTELLKVLPPKQREILVLRVVVGLSAEETADAVGSTPGAVRAAQHRALARLRSAAARWEL